MNAKSVDELNERMLKEFLAINPQAGSEMGLHDPYDFQLPHGGLKRLQDTRDLLTKWAMLMDQAAAGGERTREQELHRQLLGMSADITAFAIDEYQLWKKYPDALESLGWLLLLPAMRNYAPASFRAESVTSRLRQVPQHLKQFRTRFDPGEPVKLWIDIATDSCERIPGFLTFIRDTFTAQGAEQEVEAMADAAASVEPAITEQAEWLDSLRDIATDEFSLGRDLFVRLLQIRRISMTPEDILALGQGYLRDLKDERARIAEIIAPGKNVEEVMRTVQGMGPKTFEDALEATAAEMGKARRFIVENKLATVDETAVLDVIETPDFLKAMLPYAALSMSAKFDPVQKGEYLVTRPEDPKDLGSHLNDGSIINTAVHEAFPGHFHQGVRSNSRHWMLQLPHMACYIDTILVGDETVEGWAHYCEKMMFDHGYGATDTAALEMLNGAIWRAYRIIADVKLSCGDATPEEMVQLGVVEAGIPLDASRAEVKRYTRTPGQPLSYLLGRHMIIEFRKEMEEELGDRFDERKFHDLVADYGYVPLALMREFVEKELREHCLGD